MRRAVVACFTASLATQLAVLLDACGHGGVGDGTCHPQEVVVPSYESDGAIFTIPADGALDDATCAERCGDALPCVRESIDPDHQQVWCTTYVCPM